MKNLKNLGKALNKAEQKEINGGYFIRRYNSQDYTVEVSGNWGDGPTICFCDGVQFPCDGYC